MTFLGGVLSVMHFSKCFAVTDSLNPNTNPMNEALIILSRFGDKETKAQRGQRPQAM